ncbi:MAG: hypothetical protein LBV36_06085 [Chromatiales bacterium]|jgi:opacity protein-like surface antigen|nr:hypothetical protein [Chromatiales bacterium]
MNRRVLALLLSLAACANALADDVPRWAFEIKGGVQRSAMAQWREFYDDNRMPIYAFGIGYKPWRPLEIGIDTAYLQDRGHGFAPGHGEAAGNVRYRLIPVHLSLTARAVFDEDQWLVPYAGIALGRYAYRMDISGQNGISGATNGERYRIGLQLLLDHIEPSAAEGMQTYGIDNTYFFLEYQESKAKIAGSDLGGKAWLGGLLLEF